MAKSVTGAHRLGVNDPRRHIEPRRVLRDPGIAFGPVDASHGVEPHPALAGVDLQPEPIVFDFMHPAFRARRFLNARRQAGINEGYRR